MLACQIVGRALLSVSLVNPQPGHVGAGMDAWWGWVRQIILIYSWILHYLYPLQLSSFLCMACGDELDKCVVLFEVFECVFIKELFSDLVAYVSHRTLVWAELACFASSHWATKKSLNDSPGCWTHYQNCRHSGFCLCSLNVVLEGSNNLFGVTLCVAVWPRLSIVVTVSRENHRVSTFTCLDCECLSSPEKLRYTSHWDLQALKSVLLSTWRLPYRNM